MIRRVDFSARKPWLWAGLLAGWGGMLAAVTLARPWREAAFAFSWAAFMLAWTRLTPCASGDCASGACASPEPPEPPDAARP